MKKVLIFMFLCYNSIAQDTINVNLGDSDYFQCKSSNCLFKFKDNVKDGIYKVYESEKLLGLATLTNGKLNGKCAKYIQRSGSVVIDNYLNGKLEGESISKDKDGKIVARLLYKNDTLRKMFLLNEYGDKSIIECDLPRFSCYKIAPYPYSKIHVFKDGQEISLSDLTMKLSFPDNSYQAIFNNNTFQLPGNFDLTLIRELNIKYEGKSVTLKSYSPPNMVQLPLVTILLQDFIIDFKTQESGGKKNYFVKLKGHSFELSNESTY